jgi:hypothetical protein
MLIQKELNYSNMPLNFDVLKSCVLLLIGKVRFKMNQLILANKAVT